MNVDWSKAPEGATHYLPSSGDWFKKELGKWFYWFEGARSWAETAYADPSNFSWWGCRIERPSVTPWNGEGLPPVGAVVEWFSPVYGWLGGRVVGHDGTVAVISHNDGYTGCHPHGVRPIRTPEQLAAEAREREIAALADALAEMLTGHWAAANAPKIAEALYDAGYRKQEQPE